MLGSIGIAAFAPAFTTSGLPAATTIVDRSSQIREQALTALQELREIGVEAVAQSLRHVIQSPSLDVLRSVVAFLGQPTSGSFANAVAKLWGPVAEAYAKQPDPNAALGPAVDIQMKPLLQQLDTVLGAINQLAAAPTVDQLSATIGVLSQPQAGMLGPKLAHNSTWCWPFSPLPPRAPCPQPTEARTIMMPFVWIFLGGAIGAFVSSRVSKTVTLGVAVAAAAAVRAKLSPQAQAEFDDALNSLSADEVIAMFSPSRHDELQHVASLLNQQAVVQPTPALPPAADAAAGYWPPRYYYLGH